MINDHLFLHILLMYHNLCEEC